MKNKNIHLIQTDKPSRLAIDDEELFLSNCLKSPSFLYENQHIYITNNDKPKPGEWCIDINEFRDTKPLLNIAYKNDICPEGIKQLKVVITNDFKLIANGVQEISEEFLQWFVQNSSCESVEVVPDYSKSVMNYSYKIIIPKKEPEQETLEEVAEKEASLFYEKGSLDWNKYRQVFIEGAESDVAKNYWFSIFQSEQANKYSEEDMLEASKYGYNFHKTTQFPEQDFEDSCIRNTKQWLKQFKKK